jgi:serine phosphatase RsbU (regulator of sigma subunit)/CHASE3 domain sensor protein
MWVEDTCGMRLSLRWKIVGGFSLLLGLIALLGWLTLSQFDSLRSVQRRVFRDAIPGLVTVDEIVRSFTSQSAAVRGFLIGSQQTLLDQYRSEVEASQFWEARADELFRSSEERELLSELTSAGDSFHQLVDDQVVPLATRGQRSQAFRVLGQEGTPLITEIERLGGLLRESQDRVMVETETDLVSVSNSTILILVLVTAGALMLGTVLAVTLPRRLVRNLSKLVDAARAVGRGDFDQKIDISTRDEVGELATRFGEMQVGLKRLQQLALQDKELEIAASIQRNLLQRSLPETPGARIFPLQRQANLVGGDWYDVEVRGRFLSLVVGDASGKGIGAALMATVALASLRAELGRGASGARVIDSINQALTEATDPESFTTLVYIRIDLQTGEATWMNMGHHAPFLLRPSTPGQEPLTTGHYLEGIRNRALGWYDDPGRAESFMRLQPGDRLVLFTDGFLEAKSPEGEVVGDHRFGQVLLRLASLDTESLIKAVVADVERFAAGKLDDDLTMLIVEFLGAPLEETSEKGLQQQWHSRR